MMMRRCLFPLMLAITVPAAAQTSAIGIYGQWGSFEGKAPRSCYAIATPQNTRRRLGWKPFVSVAYWPEQRIRQQVHVRLSREKRPGSAVLLRIDDRTFQLIAGKLDAWAPDAGADAEIVAAMRTGVEMRVETRTTSGLQVRDNYSLRGAATAIDAAAIACWRQG